MVSLLLIKIMLISGDIDYPLLAVSLSFGVIAKFFGNGGSNEINDRKSKKSRKSRKRIAKKSKGKKKASITTCLLFSSTSTQSVEALDSGLTAGGS